MHIVSNWDNLHEISNPVFWEKISMASAEHFTGVVSDKDQIHYENKPIQIYWKFLHQKLKVFK